MKTVKVRIALEINPNGQWQAYGFSNAESWDDCMSSFEMLDGHHVKRHWIEAEVAVPAEEPETVIGAAAEAA